MTTDIRLKDIHRITAILVLRSGLHIGAGKDTIEIGGVDSPVLKNPFTLEPYIPGSSVKGKLRSLLEWTLDCIESNGGVWGSDRNGFKTGKYTATNPILRIFGTTHKEWTAGPTRLTVRDAHLEQQWAEQILGQGLGLTEEKTEVSIDRIQGKAAAMGPRRMERVPAGARFNLEMVFKVFEVDGDDGKTDRLCLDRLLEGLKLLERDALGGSGSRGYGRVALEELRVDDRDIQDRFDAIKEVRKDTVNALFGQVANG